MENGENNSYKINLRKRNPTTDKISKPKKFQQLNLVNKEINNKVKNGKINETKNIMDINEIEFDNCDKLNTKNPISKILQYFFVVL